MTLPILTMTLSCIVWHSEILVENRWFWPTTPVFGALLGMNPLEFCQDLCQQKTRVALLSYGAVCVILPLAVLVQYRLVMDRQTDIAHTTLANW